MRPFAAQCCGAQACGTGSLPPVPSADGVNGLLATPWAFQVGSALSLERENHKKSQIVGVFEVVPVLPDTMTPAAVMSQISEAKEKIDNYGVKLGPIDENDYGFDQFLLDSEKKSFDPLP